MPSKSLQFVLGVLVLGAAVAPIVVLRVEHTSLQRRLQGQRELTQHSRLLTEENRMLRELAAKTSGDAGAATATVHADLEAARREVAELEKRARVQRTEVIAQAAQDADALANNRDPQRALTRTEYFT